MEAIAPPPSTACQAGGSFTSVADSTRLRASRQRSNTMSAGSDPVVIVSAARTAIGECPAGSLRPATHLPVRCAETRALVTGRGEAGHGLYSPVPRASPATPPLTLRLVPRSRATALPSSPIGWRWDALSVPIADWSAQRSTTDHAVVAGDPELVV